MAMSETSDDGGRETTETPKEAPPLRMDAYYYSFEPTGVRAIDRILSAVASAGKSYHNTSEWTDGKDWQCKPHAPHPEFGGASCVEWIQNAANDAAREFMVGAVVSAGTPARPETVLTRDEAIEALRVFCGRWEVLARQHRLHAALAALTREPALTLTVDDAGDVVIDLDAANDHVTTFGIEPTGRVYWSAIEGADSGHGEIGYLPTWVYAALVARVPR